MANMLKETTRHALALSLTGAMQAQSPYKQEMQSHHFFVCRHEELPLKDAMQVPSQLVQKEEGNLGRALAVAP